MTFDTGDLVAAMLATGAIAFVFGLYVETGLGERRRARTHELGRRWREAIRGRYGAMVREYQREVVKLRAHLRLLGGDPNAGDEKHGRGLWLQ